MIRLPEPVSWGLVISSPADGTQPSATYGTSITPGNNTMGSFAEVVSDTSEETFLMHVLLHANDVSTAARDTIVTLGFDFDGGTSYSHLTIDNLLASHAASLVNAGVNGIGVHYTFPLYVPSGTAIAAQASVNNATVGTLRCAIRLYGRPSRPVRAGRYVRTYGADTANSRGTTITPGTAAEGAYTQLGTIAAGDDIWAWEVGRGANDGSLTAAFAHVDIAVGDATNKKIVITDAHFASGSNENISKPSALTYGRGIAGDLVYGREQGSAAADTSVSLCAYGIGG